MKYQDYHHRVRKAEREHKRFGRIVTIVMVICIILSFLGLYFIGAHLLRPWLDKLDKIEASAVPVATMTVTIEPGATLWHIAREWHPDTDPRETVYIIRQLNPGLDPGRLQVGQQILVPELLEVE